MINWFSVFCAIFSILCSSNAAVDLRILPLGDSITFGYQSSDGNGYRQQLLTDLQSSAVFSGKSITLIGSIRAGTMADNQNEGHSGAIITEITSFAANSLPERPNVILIHAGTNDMDPARDPADAQTNLGNLIDAVLVTCPDALVLVAQIIKSSTTTTEANIVTYNAAIPSIVASRVAKGFKVRVVDMFSQLSTSTNYADALHPNDSGYAIMGDTWKNAIVSANSAGLISQPVSGTNRVVCGNLPTWVPQGVIATGVGQDSYPSIVCSDISGDSTHCTCKNSDGSGTQSTVTKTGSSCPDMGYDEIHAVRFADLNGDGLAEYIRINDDGTVVAYLNQGAPSGKESTQGATVQWLPQGTIALGVGAARQEVQFADINGDGKADFLWVHINGSVEAWLNLGGPNDGANAAQVAWFYNGVIATGIGAPGSSIVFADINGDGRAEYLSVAANGAVTAYLNLGPTSSDPSQAAKVGWQPQGVIATGVGGVRSNTVFADMNGDGRADYLSVARSGPGAVSEWLNLGGPASAPAQVIWYAKGNIATGDASSGATVVFADLNGDGRAEYIELTPGTGAATAYLNTC